MLENYLWLSLLVGIAVFATLLWCGVLSPLRQTQVFLIYACFSFVLRPVASGICHDFNPFYNFPPQDYIHGVFLGSTYILLFTIVVAVFSRPYTHRVAFDPKQLQQLLTLLFIVCVASVSMALGLYGTTILPGFRSTGLSIAAPGSQIFFAITAVCTHAGVSLAVLLMLSVRSAVMRNVWFLLGFFFLSMVFYQRGSYIAGVLFGLFVAGYYNRKRLLSAAPKIVLLCTILITVAVFGRSIIVGTVNFLYEESAQAKYENTTTVACSIANSANQEHDQVWPILVRYVDEKGLDYYKNFLAALSRPFLSSDARQHYGLATSVDNVNIYNDADNYLERNFGFSLHGMHYHFYAVGGLFLLIAIIVAAISVRVENQIKVTMIDARGFLRLVIINQFLIFLLGAFDERLKWFVMSVSLMAFIVLVVFPFYKKRYR